MSRDLALYFSNKLASEWSASSVTGLLTPAVVEDISTTQKWEALDPLVRVRLLLAPMFLRRQELADLRPALTTLSKSVVAQDSDEWVRVIAAAVGSYDGILHMDGVVEHSKLVKATLEELKRHGAGADSKIFRPIEEKYLSATVLEKRLPGSSVERKHIPEHGHFILRDPIKARGNSEPCAPTNAAAPTATATGVPPRPSSSGLFKPSKPSTGGPLMPRKPPMGPSRLAAPGGGGGSGSGSGSGGSLFMPGRKPLGGGLSSGGLTSRAAGSAALGGSKSGFKEKKKAAIIDIGAVAKLNQAAALEREKKQKKEEEEKEAAALARSEAKRLEKEAKEEKKKREIARAAAAKEAEKEAEKAKKEADALAAKEAKEAAKAAKEAAKEEAAKKKAEEQGEKEAQRAQREAEKIEKERAKAARAELKRAAGGGESGGERPAKASKKTAGATAAGAGAIPTAIATAQQLMNSSIIQPGTNGEAPLVQLIDPAVALAAFRAAEAMSQGVYGDYTVLQQQHGGGGDGDEEDEDEAMQRYIEMGKASAAAAEMQRKEEQRQKD